MTDRQVLRTCIRQKRRELSLSSQQIAAYTISNFVQKKSWFQNAQNIGFYSAIRGEVDPYLLIKASWQAHKMCYLPALSCSMPNHLCFYPYSQKDLLEVNRYGIYEPSHSLLSLNALTLLNIVFVPLVAFDEDGNRLGSGKGFYDRTFAGLRHMMSDRQTKLIGLGYEFQRVSRLSVEDWDVPLDEVVVFDVLQKHVYSLFNL